MAFDFSSLSRLPMDLKLPADLKPPAGTGLEGPNLTRPGLVDVDGPAFGGQGATGFAKAVGDALREVNQMQGQASDSRAALARGEDVDLHQVMVETQEAGLAFQLTLALRNKAVDAYQEVLRMQI